MPRYSTQELSVLEYTLYSKLSVSRSERAEGFCLTYGKDRLVESYKYMLGIPCTPQLGRLKERNDFQRG